MLDTVKQRRTQVSELRINSVNLEQTVTLWIDQLRGGDEDAAQKLWERYFGQMVNLARDRLWGAKRGVADEEDVALSAFKSFCLGAKGGKFPQLMDRDTLWPLLVAIVSNKSVDLIRHENRQKRGGTGNVDSDEREPPKPEQLSQLISQDPTPEFAGEISELFERMILKLDSVDDDDLVVIAVRRMMGDSAAEIAADLDCVTRTVERKVVLIQRLWEEEAAK
jgi:DNA-directed RNA polymerase specialized sigma24 family protein